MLKTDSKEFLQNIVLMLAAILICLIVAEIILRTCCPLGTSTIPNLYKDDTELGYVLSPDQTIIDKQPEFSIIIKTNSFGLRNDPIDISTLKKSDLVILGLGDSYTFGAGVNNDQTFLAKMESLLIQDNLHTITLNAGIGGYGTAQEVILAKRLVPIFRPNMVILGFFLGNDINDNATFLSSSSISSSTQQTTHVHPWHYFIKTLDHLYIYSYVHRLKLTTPIVARLFWHINHPSDESTNYEQFHKDYSSAMNQKWFMTRGKLKELNENLRKQKITLLILLIPYQFQINSELRQPILSLYDLHESSLDLHKPNALIQQFAEENQIPIIDATDILGRDPKKYFYRLDGHLTPLGHAEVAKLLYNSLKEQLTHGKK